MHAALIARDSASIGGVVVTRQSVANWCFSLFVVLFLVYVILVQWSGDVQQGAFRNPDLIRWANRVLAIPTIGFGVYGAFLGALTLREGKYPPPGAIVPFATKRQVNWNPFSTGLGLLLGSACAVAAPLLIAASVGW